MKTENHITDSKLARFSTRAHWSFFSCLFEQQFPTSQNIWATTVANLCYQLDENTKLPYYTLPPTQNHSFFRNVPLLFYLLFVYLFTCFVRIHAHSSVGPFIKFACLMLCSSVSTVSPFNFQIFFLLISYPKACIPVSTTNRHARRISVDNRPNLKQIIRMTSVPSNIILHILHEVEFLIV